MPYFSFINTSKRWLQAGVTDIHVLRNGFVSCGGDGSVKLVQLKNDFAAVNLL
jgi:hypothetical protein